MRSSNLAAYDQPLYLGIASDILQFGTYTNGRFGAPAMPGAYTAPLYPAFVAAVAALDPALRTAAACVRISPFAAIPSCAGSLGLLVPVQVALFAATLALVWRTTLAVGGGRWAAWCALLAAGLGTTEYAVYARTAMTEALSLPLSALAGLLLIRLVQRPRLGMGAALGAVLGLLTLARPEYLYLLAALGVGGVGAMLARRWRRTGRALALAALAGGLVLAPWSVRNERLFGTPSPTFGYAGFILGQRVVYDRMTPAEWTAQWIEAMPGFGPALARMVLPGAVARLGYQERPDTFYMIGNTAMVSELAANAPNPADQVGYLLRRYVFPHPFAFLAVTVVMAWKLLWVRKYFSLVTVPFFAVMTWRALRRPDPARLALALPPLFILLLHAATTVGTPRYSLNLVPAYAAAFGLSAGPWLQRRWSRLRR